MTHSASASDPSPSHAQPQSDPLTFQCGCTMCHTVSHDVVPLYMSAYLHALTRIRVAPEGPCMLPCLHALLVISI